MSALASLRQLRPTRLFLALSSMFIAAGGIIHPVLGWTEPSWTPGAEQTRIVEVAAIAALVALAVLSHRDPSGHSDPNDPHHHEASDRGRASVATPVPVPG